MLLTSLYAYISRFLDLVIYKYIKSAILPTMQSNSKATFNTKINKIKATRPGLDKFKP